MRLAYADPPYIGCARRHYKCAEVDHAELVARLQEYDGWALSCSTPTLGEILRLFPGKQPRIGAWVKPFAFYKPGVWPAFAWEPVVFKPARKIKFTKERPTPKDWVLAKPKGMTKAEREALHTKGAKPEEFSVWLFDQLGAEREDTLDDMFPGSGLVSRAWEAWRAA